MRALLLSLLAIASSSAAAGECPLIRPPGLSPQQVDAVVLSTYAQALRMPGESLDVSKTLKALDGTENAILTYSFATLGVGENLGFDAVRTFFDAAKAKGASQPFESLTISEILALARAEYAKGVDSRPPVATPDMAFKVHAVTVNTPEPAKDWHLLRCTSEHVAFQRQSSGTTSTAVVRVTGLSRYRSSAEFLTLVKSMMASAVPAGFNVGQWQPTAADASVPCADARFTATTSSQAVHVRGRICYASAESTFGYATLYSINALSSVEVQAAEAETFVTRSSPR